MPPRPPSAVRTALLITALVIAVAITVQASPPRPGTDGNGLDENESATLWAGDDDTGYVNNTAYVAAYGANRTAVHEVANGTDWTFKRPPHTAATWSHNDFHDYAPGGTDASVYPTAASTRSGRFIEDAHATIFAVHPATRVHVEPGQTPLYVAPQGTLRGVVDYRVDVPPDRSTTNRTVTWRLRSARIDEVRLLDNGTVILDRSGTHTPALPYVIGGGDTRLTLEADIEVAIRYRRVDTIPVAPGPNGTTPPGQPAAGPGQPAGNRTRTVVTERVLTETMTVSDSVDVVGYDLDVMYHTVTYPDGSKGLALFRTMPWQGATLDQDGTHRIRGNWRFYTARDSGWDVLVTATENRTVRQPSNALPVTVHAYPSTLGLRTEPIGQNLTLLDRWGIEHDSPHATLGDGVTVDVVTQPYETTYGLAVRGRGIDPNAMVVHGIVRGVDATIVPPTTGPARVLRESRLTATVTETTASSATVRLELRDAVTGDPIELGRPNVPRYIPIADDAYRSGYVSIDGQQVQTNATGVAVVTLDHPGAFTAEYHPESWLSYDPAYTSSTATVRWHPLTTTTGWLALSYDAALVFAPFLLALYLARRLTTMITYTHRR